jgi:hypothetical protein
MRPDCRLPFVVIGFVFLFALGLSSISGIGLFTHHKYRKSIESTVPLDAHGNPIIEETRDPARGWRRSDSINFESGREIIGWNGPAMTESLGGEDVYCMHT